jgi:hypothetical protein
VTHAKNQSLSGTVLLLAISLVLCAIPRARAAGVTLITHGFNGDVESWVIPMSQAIPRYPNFPGTNFTCYEISISNSGGQLVASQSFIGGADPLASDTGEIFVKLDWSTVSGIGGSSTVAVATTAAAALLSTNLIPAMGGHALTEFPLHLIGHSRGGSLVTELARVLGAQGVWADHVTTLDPDPVSLFGDPALKDYANVLFADNYWQNMGDGITVPNGQALTGAYNRQLTNLNGGYSSSHSDVHLWYHGTIDLTTPVTVDSASISNAQRQTWWTPLEQQGTNAGFLYSLIGGGNRSSSLEPAGTGKGRISDGYRDLSVTVPTNRTALPTNNSAWPNVIRFNLSTTNPTPVGIAIPFSLYHQSGSNQSVSVDLRLFLDADLNPFDTNEIRVLQTTLAGTGTNSIALTNGSFAPDPALVGPGSYRVFARITDGGHSRFLYAPGSLTLTASILPPRLVALGLSNGVFQLLVNGYIGQQVVVDASPDLVTWTPIATNTLATGSVEISDAHAAGLQQRFYRAVLIP